MKFSKLKDSFLWNVARRQRVNGSRRVLGTMLRRNVGNGLPTDAAWNCRSTGSLATLLQEVKIPNISLPENLQRECQLPSVTLQQTRNGRFILCERNKFEYSWPPIFKMYFPFYPSLIPWNFTFQILVFCFWIERVDPPSSCFSSQKVVFLQSAWKSSTSFYSPRAITKYNAVQIKT